jgi:predicted Zn-dependent protease
MIRETDGTRIRSLGAFALALGLFSSTSCAVNPATGGRMFTLMTEGQEIQMGRDADPGIVASMGLYPDDELQRYVQELGTGLAARSERPNLPWTFRVLDDPLINAFALPGGYIYVTRGIMAYLDSEAELVGVLGHEIGHVTARHSVEQISRAQLAQLGLGIGMVLRPELQRFEGLASASLQLLFLKFGRDDEHQADELGVRYMGRLGYDPTRLSGVMGMLGRVTSGEEGSGPPEWLSTHPNPDNREENILGMAARADVALDPPKVARAEYLRRLDGLIFGENPREGFFLGSRFVHPEMAFEMVFPEGWATVNTKAAVQGLSPDEDAVLQLTLAEGADPEAALSAFLSMSGMQAGARALGPVNGLPAASADFRFTGDGGTVEGRASFVRVSGTVLQLVAFGVPSAWDQRGSELRRALGSFRPLEDPALLGVQPARLRLVTVPRTISLDRLLAQESSSEWTEEVRLLNRLEGNPTLEAGRILKIPVGERLPGEDGE